MKNNNLKILLFTATVLVLPLSAFFAFDYLEANFKSLPFYGPISTDEAGNEVYHQIPDFAFTNQHGGTLSRTDLESKIFVANYFFTSCPSICPKMTRNLQKVQEIYLNDPEVAILSYTVDPKRDIPERLKAFAEQYHADPQQWQFLTGDKKELYRLARKGYFISATDGDGGPGDFIHSENIVLVDRRMRIRGYYNGTDAKAVEQLIKDIAKLKNSKP